MRTIGNTTSARTRPDLLVFLLTCLIWTNVWRVQDMFPILAKVKFPMLVLGVTVLVFMMDGDPRRRLRSIDGPIVRMLGVLLGVMIIGVPAGLYPGRSFTMVTKDFIPVLAAIIMMAVSVRSRWDVEHYMRWTFYGALLYAVFIEMNFSISTGGRLGNLVYYDSNDFALLLVCTLPLALFVARSGTMIQRILALVGIALFVYELMKSGSRGGFIGFAVVMLWVLLRFSAISTTARFSAVAAAVGLLVTVGSAEYWQQMATLLNPKEDYNWSGNAEEGRMEVWKRGVGYMFSYPIAGVGTRNFPIAEGTLTERGRANTLEGDTGFKWSAPHNSFVEIGAETGIVGFSLFVGCLVVAFRMLARARHRKKGEPKPAPWLVLDSQALTTALLGFCTAGFFVGAAYYALPYVLYAQVLGLEKAAAGERERAATEVEMIPPAVLIRSRMRGGLIRSAG